MPRITQAESTLKLEEDIAYFYGAHNPKLVADHYINALLLIDKTRVPLSDEDKSRARMHLEAAYAEVQTQTCLQFDVLKAASLEFDLMLVNIENAPFEVEYQLLLNIYRVVFHTRTHEIERAALLRTFLYRYKNHLLSTGETLHKDDIALLRVMARRSEIQLP